MRAAASIPAVAQLCDIGLTSTSPYVLILRADSPGADSPAREMKSKSPPRVSLIS